MGSCSQGRGLGEYEGRTSKQLGRAEVFADYLDFEKFTGGQVTCYKNARK